ncbi:QcrA and Rieske domain-containing protein [Algoriphagus algorifonticola]|jgi:Rieske Fe-S protein|uniref:QcrA and Rieske domain-containing protein n=1 Tax=Algoriphagus algorifonticola TaxID=2593007 RepID=UPI0011A3D32A|nr:Rieske 2Fe-2S domain-containing protein [Algoriphagus algorifonticola]
MDRKEFIKTCGFACLGGTTLAVLLESCAGTNYLAQTSYANNQITIPKTEFIRIAKDKTIQRKYVLVRHDKFSYPICVYKLDEENYSALLMQCTHKGCELQAQGDFLICPCHGSEFTNQGVVQNPPAEQDLQTFKISTDNENIYIYL